MLDHLLRSSRVFFVGAILIATPAIAYAPTPSQEFWEYIAEYGDDNGDVIDPLEYDQIITMKENEMGQGADTDIVKEKVSVDKDKSRTKNIDMKFEQKSSLQNSSAGTKGARL